MRLSCSERELLQRKSRLRARRLRTASLRCPRRGQHRSSDAPRSISDGARGTVDGDGCARDRGDVGTDLEGIANIFAFELLGELWKFDRKVAIRFVVLRNENAG